MNECHFIGRLASDPIYHPNLNKCTFTLAVYRKFKRADGSPAEMIQFLDFEVWDSAAETIAKCCHKGELLIIDRASACSWPVTLQDDTKINRIVFRVDKFSFQSTLFGRKNAKKTSDSVDG